MIIGRIGVPGTKAPVLNLIRNSPLVVVASGKINNGVEEKFLQ